jgi:hypothetical protein
MSSKESISNSKIEFSNSKRNQYIVPEYGCKAIQEAMELWIAAVVGMFLGYWRLM